MLRFVDTDRKRGSGSVNGALKGLRHEDFAILGQFCANSLLSAFTGTQNAPTKLRGRY